MPSFTPKSKQTLLSALVGAATVAAHGHVESLDIAGEEFEGFNPQTFPYLPNPPVVIGWEESAEDNGFVLPSQFQTPDIICHKNAHNAGTHATVAPGGSVTFKWDVWPAGAHKGPVMDYMAACGDAGCENVDKTDLEFFKIDEMGMITPSYTAGTPGRWAADLLVENGLQWTVTIPVGLAPGNYVLRHEIIALHEGFNYDGAQNYPQCINIEITGDGTDVPQGVPGMELYTATDPGILFDIYDNTKTTYPIPGPAVYTRGITNAPVVVEEEEVYTPEPVEEEVYTPEPVEEEVVYTHEPDEAPTTPVIADDEIIEAYPIVTDEEVVEPLPIVVDYEDFEAPAPAPVDTATPVVAEEVAETYPAVSDEEAVAQDLAPVSSMTPVVHDEVEEAEAEIVKPCNGSNGKGRGKGKDRGKGKGRGRKVYSRHHSRGFLRL